MEVRSRNSKLLNFFKSRGIKSARYIGNPAMPAVIMHESTVVSCHVSRNSLYFTDTPKNGKVVLEVDLDENSEISREELLEVLSSCEHRRCYKIQLTGGELYESLVSHLGEDVLFLKDYHKNAETGVKSPLFRPGRDVKLYFEKEQAQEAVDKIKENHEDLILTIV